MSAELGQPDTGEPDDPRRVDKGRSTMTTAARVVYEIRDWDGTLVARHVRSQWPDGRKTFFWQRSDGSSGLGGVAVVDLPLYGSERLMPLKAGALIVVTEGEKAADALLALDIPAVGTVCGAAVCPSDDVLKILAGFEVAAWPDLDRGGREHMDAVLKGLRRLKGAISGLWIIDGSTFGLTEKGADAADWTPPDDPTDELWCSLKAWSPAPDPPPPPLAEDGTEKEGPHYFLVKAGRCADGVLAALDFLGITPRYNVRSAHVEFLSLFGPDPSRWEETDDMIRAELRDTFAKRCRVKMKAGLMPFTLGINKFDDLLNAILNTRRVDPFKVWLDSLPAWDRESRIDIWLSGCFTVGDMDPDLYRWACRSVLMAAVYRTDHPGEKHDEMVVLVGPQDVGKSTAWAWLFPQQHRADWFTDGLNFHADEKAKVEAMQGRVLVEAAEMSGSTRAELESLKAFLSRTNDGSVRLTYRRDPGRLLRRCVIVGTSNDPRCLPNDPSGNRRFVPVPVVAGTTEKIREFLDEHRDQMWAEAVHRVRQNRESAYLPQALKYVQRELTEQFRATDEIAEDLIDGYLAKHPGRVTLQEVTTGIRWEHDQRSTSRIIRVFKQRRYTPDATQTRSDGTRKRYWYPPENT